MQEELWHDSIEEALRSIIDAVGGPKSVAMELWPSRKMTEGARHLHHCLDPERPEKLALCELLWIARKGREAGVHTLMHYLAKDLGYQAPLPVEPDDERVRLQREFTESVQLQRRILNRMEKLNAEPPPRFKAVPHG
jgi:hypothetical protein